MESNEPRPAQTRKWRSLKESSNEAKSKRPQWLNARAMMEYDSQKRSAFLAYLLLFGVPGLHRVYVGRKSGWVMLGLSVAGSILFFAGITILLLVAVFIWCLIDLLSLYDYVKEYNDRLGKYPYTEALKEAKPMMSEQLNTKAMIEYDAKKKSVVVAYLLLIFAGMLGAHRAYLKRNSVWIIPTLGIVGFISLLPSSSAESFGGRLWLGDSIRVLILLVVCVWLFVDLFLLYGHVRRYNNLLWQSSQQMNLNLDTESVSFYKRSKKSIVAAYFLLMFLGFTGAHRIHLRLRSGWVMLSVFCLSVVSVLAFSTDDAAYLIQAMTYLPPIALFLWVLTDLFLLYGYVENHNNALLEKLIPDELAPSQGSAASPQAKDEPIEQ